MKLMVRFDLVLLRVWLRLVMYSFEAVMNLLALLLLMGMMICLWGEPLVVMLILGLDLSNFCRSTC